MSLLAPGDELDKYLVKRPLGRGHFGEVYHCLDRGLNSEKALKLVRVKDPVAFREIMEAQVAHKCRHDHCVTINEVNVFNLHSKPYVAIDMELIDGSSVEALVANDRVSIHGLVKIMRGALYGLVYKNSNHLTVAARG